MSEEVDSLQRMVKWGRDNGKRSVVVDLDALAELFDQRDKLMKTVRCVLTSLSQTSGQVPPIVTCDLADQCHAINQELNLL